MFTSDSENKPTLRCPQCEFTTKFQHHFKQHLTFHRQKDEGIDGIEQCRECCKFFDSKKALKNHVKIHSDDTLVHACDKCGKRFRDTSNLKVHLLTHSGVKPFKCDLPGCNYACTTKQWLQRHYRGKHKLSTEEMPTITRQIPFTIEAYTKSAKSKKNTIDDNNNNNNNKMIKMESDSSSSSFDHVYSPASQSASSTYSPVSYNAAYSPATSQSLTPTYPHSPIPSSTYTPASQPSTPTYQQREAPTSFAEMFFSTTGADLLHPRTIKQGAQPLPSPSYQAQPLPSPPFQAQMSPEEGIVPQELLLEDGQLPSLLGLIPGDMISTEALLGQSADILPIFSLPILQIPEVVNESNNHSGGHVQAHQNIPTPPPPQTHNPSPPTPPTLTSEPPTSMPPPPPYNPTGGHHSPSPKDTSYSLAISTRAQSFLEQLGDPGAPPPSYYEAVYQQYSTSASGLQAKDIKQDFPSVHSAFYDTTSLQRDMQFADL